MLDTLSDMEIANTIMKTTNDKARDQERVALIDKRFEQLKLDHATPLEKSTNEYRMLKEYLINTTGKTHNIRFSLHDIFRIKRTGEDDRFTEAYGARQDTCRRLLWHGSRTTNYGGILSQGLRIAPPEAPVSGYAFGKGIYMADISTKSANYCATHLSGKNGLILLCEAELGSPVHELLQGDSNAAEDSQKAGRISTLGIGRTIPTGWVDAGIVHEDLKGVLMVSSLEVQFRGSSGSTKVWRSKETGVPLARPLPQHCIFPWYPVRTLLTITVARSRQRTRGPNHAP